MTMLSPYFTHITIYLLLSLPLNVSTHHHHYSSLTPYITTTSTFPHLTIISTIHFPPIPSYCYHLHLPSPYCFSLLFLLFFSFSPHRESGCTTLLLKPLRLQLVKKALSKLGIDYVEKWYAFSHLVSPRLVRLIHLVVVVCYKLPFYVMLLSVKSTPQLSKALRLEIIRHSIDSFGLSHLSMLISIRTHKAWNERLINEMRDTRKRRKINKWFFLIHSLFFVFFNFIVVKTVFPFLLSSLSFSSLLFSTPLCYVVTTYYDK